MKLSGKKLLGAVFMTSSLLWSGLTLAGMNKFENIRHVSSEECQECHEEIYDQWKGSMHAQSTALEDPIHGTFYKAVVGKPTLEDVRTKSGKYPVCLQCHSPAAAKDQKTKLDSKVSYNEGVNCISCHTMTKFKGTKKPDGGLRLGMQAYEFSDTTLQGPKGFDSEHKKFGKKAFDAPQIANNPGLFRTSDACMGCHDQRPNSKNVPLCATGDEVMAAGGSTTCQTCHMPSINGESNHSMMGGHSPSVVSKGLVMTMDTHKSGNNIQATINIRNLLPHNFPTGAPFRNFYVKTKAYDKNGVIVWQSSNKHPMKEDKLAMMMLKLGDKGKPAPPPKATHIISDTRLKPNETRKLNYKIPAKGVVRIKSVGYYDLLLPPIKEKFGKSIPKELLQPQKVAIVEKTIL